MCESYLHQFIIAVKLRHQHILPICDTGERDTQSACGLGVTIMWQYAAYHFPHDLHKVKGRVHWSQKPLPCFLRNIDDACTCLSWKTVKECKYHTKLRTGVHVVQMVRFLFTCSDPEWGAVDNILSNLLLSLCFIAFYYAYQEAFMSWIRRRRKDVKKTDFFFFMWCST